MPLTSASSAANAGQRRALSRPSATSAASCGSASLTGASMPGGDGGRRAGERPAVHEHDAQPARPRPPGDDEAADAAADDGDVEDGVLGGWQNGLLASPA